MSELEKVKKDLEACEHLIKVFEDHFGHKSIKLSELQNAIQAKIEELEKGDDWADTQKLIADYKEYTSKGNDKWKIFEFAIHLEDENARLKAELENRPVVWCLKSYKGSLYTDGLNNLPRLFDSMLDAACYAKRHGYYWLKADIYTGKESK